MKRNRLALATSALALTAAVAYAQMRSTPQPINLSQSPTGKAFLETIAALRSTYLYPIDEKKVLQGAIQGVIGSLDDEFTYYSNPEDTQISNQDLSGEFFGIGIQLISANPDGTGGKVDNVFRGGAASEAGVHIGDVFVKVNDEDVITAKLNDIVRKVRGARGTPVTITFARDGKPYTVKMQRQPVQIVSVESTVLPGNIGYIALNTFFNTKVSEQFKAAVANMKKNNINKLIVDVRDNGGGLLDAGLDISDVFMKEGPIASLRYKDGSKVVVGSATNSPNDYTGKMVVLVNKNSASASEILSGALQDAKRATIVGEQTVGKGVGQKIVPLSDGAELRVVNFVWLTPKGREIQKKGITPDVIVKDTRYTQPFNFTGGGAEPGAKVTLQVAGKPVTVTADKDGKFTYTAEAKRPTRSATQGEAIVDVQGDAILKKALDILK